MASSSITWGFNCIIKSRHRKKSSRREGKSQKAASSSSRVWEREREVGNRRKGIILTMLAKFNKQKYILFGSYNKPIYVNQNKLDLIFIL